MSNYYDFKIEMAQQEKIYLKKSLKFNTIVISLLFCFFLLDILTIKISNHPLFTGISLGMLAYSLIIAWTVLSENKIDYKIAKEYLARLEDHKIKSLENNELMQLREDLEYWQNFHNENYVHSVNTKKEQK